MNQEFLILFSLSQLKLPSFIKESFLKVLSTTKPLFFNGFLQLFLRSHIQDWNERFQQTMQSHEVMQYLSSTEENDDLYLEKFKALGPLAKKHIVHFTFMFPRKKPDFAKKLQKAYQGVSVQDD